MPATRTIHHLTEGWPDEPENYDLQAFVAAARDERAELSAPALDRVESLLAPALDRRTVRPEQPPSRWRIVGRSAGVLARMAAPYAAAACVLVACGVWVQNRVATSPVPVVPRNGAVDVNEDAKPVVPGQGADGQGARRVVPQGG